jgi:N-dimethylarginine dimethylaminohydrolase
MVFAANQSFVFCEDKTPKVVMGVMRSQQRRPEVDHFEEWYRESGYDIHRITTPDVYFEGNGDALLDPTMRLIWGGVGPRTTRSAYEEISSKFNIPVLLLPLRCAEFYHLDTCFSILASDAVAIQPRAFDEESVRLIRDRFPTVIEIDFEENITTFAANCHSPNGRDVILHKSVSKFNSQLEQAGFTLHHVDTSEFMKSGGSVFCMKMMVY